MNTKSDNTNNDHQKPSNQNKRSTLQERKAKLEKKHKEEMARIRAQIKAQDARDKAKDRKAATRYKIIEGALCNKHRLANPNSELAKTMNRLLAEYVIKVDERLYFGLGVLPEDEKIKRLEEQKFNRKKQSDIESMG